MGVIICQSHGRQGIMLVCPHLERATRDHTLIDGWAKVEVTLDGEFAYGCHYCFNCADRFKVPRGGFTVEMPEDEGSGWLFSEEVPVCGRCFRENTERVPISS